MIITGGEWIRLHIDAFLTSSYPSPCLLSLSIQTTVFIPPGKPENLGCLSHKTSPRKFSIPSEGSQQACWRASVHLDKQAPRLLPQLIPFRNTPLSCHIVVNPSIIYETRPRKKIRIRVLSFLGGFLWWFLCHVIFRIEFLDFPLYTFFLLCLYQSEALGWVEGGIRSDCLYNEKRKVGKRNIGTTFFFNCCLIFRIFG